MPGSSGTAPAPDLPSGPRHALVVATTAFGSRSMIAAAQSTMEIKQAQQFMNPAAREAAAAQSPALLKQIEQFRYPTYHDAAIRVWT
jgi:hypothetical protein